MLFVGGLQGMVACVVVFGMCLVQPSMFWKLRVVWVTSGVFLALAYGMTAVFVPEDVTVSAYAVLLAVIVAPIAVARFIDGFWICGWLAALRLPKGVLLATASAGAALPLILEDVRTLVYLKRRFPRRMAGSSLGVLIASGLSLLDHIVSLEIAFEMHGMLEVLERWKGRRIQQFELVFLVAILAMVVGVAFFS